MAVILCADLLGRLHEMLPFGDRIPVGKVMLPLGMFVLLASKDFRERLRALQTWQGAAFLLFAVATILSVPLSLVPGAAFAYMVVFGYAVIPFVLIAATGPGTVREFQAVGRGIAIVAICLGGVMFVRQGWDEGGRLSAGGTYDPNDIALVAVVCLPFATALLRERVWLWRAVGIIAAAMALLVVVLSASRGGMIATAVVLALTIVRSRYNMPRGWKLLSLPAAALILLLAPPVFWQRLSSLGGLSNDYNMTSEGGRVQIWKRGMATFAAHPIVGVGGGQFAVSDGMAASRVGSDDQSWHTAHNSVLQIAVELGLLGVVGLIGLHLPTMRAARRARTLAGAGLLDPAVATVGEALFLSIIGFYVAGMFLSAADSYASFTLGALGMAFTAMLRRGVGMSTAPAAALVLPSGWRSIRGALSASGPVA